MVTLPTDNSNIEIKVAKEGMRLGWRVKIVPKPESNSPVEEEQGFGNTLQINSSDGKLRVYDHRGPRNVHLILTTEPPHLDY